MMLTMRLIYLCFYVCCFFFVAESGKVVLLITKNDYTRFIKEGNTAILFK